MQDFYVYLHRKASDNSVFYVGKGSGRRAYDRNNRSDWWKSIVAKHGYTVEIYMDNLQEWYSFELEKELIAYYGRMDEDRGSLCNMKDGGAGCSSDAYREKSRRIDFTIYTFVNLSTLQEIKLTRREFEEKYNMTTSGLFKEIPELTINGWCLKEKLQSAMNRDTSRDRNVYKLINALTGEVFTGVRQDFKKKYKLDINGLFSAVPNKSIRGWYLADGLPVKISYFYTIYNKITDKYFYGTKKEFKELYPDVHHKLLSDTYSACVKGWKVLEKFQFCSFPQQNTCISAASMV